MNNNLKHISIKVNESNCKEEMIWILINNNHIKIRIGVVPQESRITVQEFAECYNKIENKIEKANPDKQHILVVGDCKIGNKIIGNDNTITKGGKMLIKVVKNITYII